MYKREIKFGIAPEFKAYRDPVPVNHVERNRSFAGVVALVAAVAFVLVWAIF